MGFRAYSTVTIDISRLKRKTVFPLGLEHTGMEFPVILFGYDETIGNGSQNVPLSYVQYYAHETDHHVWAIGNQQLQIEAAVPTPYEAKKILIENGISVPYSSGGGHVHRKDRLNIINLLYENIQGNGEVIVIDGTNHTGFCSRYDNWTWYHPKDFDEITRISEPDVTGVSGDPYNNTNQFGTYKEILSYIDDSVEAAK